MADTWSEEWTNAVFSEAERDRRWARVRELMRRDGIDLIVCLPCTNSHDRGQADARYLTQLGENSDEATVAFPIEGDVTAWHTRGGAWPSSNWFAAGVQAAPRGTGGRTIVDWVQAHPQLERATIGVAGLTSSLLGHVREIEGEVNWQSVDIIKRELPQAHIVSATDLLGEARFVKSGEEIGFLGKATEIAEITLEAVRLHARAGVRERHVFAQMLAANADAGGSFQPMFGWISGPLGNTHHRIEQPSFRTLQPGDVLAIEIEGRWGGYVAQIDQQFSIGPASQDLTDGMKLSFESFDRVFEALKPGITVGELIEIGRVKGMNGRGEASLTMHGRGTGDDGPLVTTRITPEMRSLELPEGCCMILKPSARVDGKPDYGHWGETVAVRSAGAERLGKRAQELYELGP
ncbi:MAG: M24 family metallopeptidase [Chloroflexi bacterium]|nr:M24 family metallopeptidase [Chloroflexota bacterium]